MPLGGSIFSGSGSERLTAGEAISIGSLVAVQQATGDAVLAISGFTQTKYDIFGVSAETVAAGFDFEILTDVISLIPVRFAVAPGAASNGSRVFLSMVAGEATLVPPNSSGNIVVFVGILQGADGVNTTPEVAFNPYIVARRP